jgi:hypothetical protein
MAALCKSNAAYGILREEASSTPHDALASALNFLGHALRGNRAAGGWGLKPTTTAHLFLNLRYSTFIWPSRGLRERKPLCSVQPVTST